MSINAAEKERLNFRFNKSVVENVKENLDMIGLDQSSFLSGFITNVANTGKMPFELLTAAEEKKAELSAELNQLTKKYEDIPELTTQKEFESWMEVGNNERKRNSSSSDE